MGGNITRDESKLFVAIDHDKLGQRSFNENLFNIVSEPMSDASEVSDPGVGGGRVVKIKKDTARKISVEVQTGSEAELFLRRTTRYKLTPFTISWSDERNGAIEAQKGTGSECYTKDVANDRGADTITFEIWSMNYSGD